MIVFNSSCNCDVNKCVAFYLFIKIVWDLILFNTNIIYIPIHRTEEFTTTIKLIVDSVHYLLS